MHQSPEGRATFTEQSSLWEGLLPSSPLGEEEPQLSPPSSLEEQDAVWPSS